MSFCLFASLFLAGNQISYCDGMILIYLLLTVASSVLQTTMTALPIDDDDAPDENRS